MCDYTCGPDINTGDYANLNNTIGIGDPVPYGNNNYGSCDIFNGFNNKAKNQKKKQKKSESSPFDLSMKPLIVKI